MIREMVGPGDEILRTKMPNFDFSNPPMDPTELANDLIETMNSHSGLGLSANQVGLPYRVFVMRSTPNFVCFNPRVVDVSEKTVLLDEGCLSFPNLVYKVARPETIKVRFTTPNGQTTTMKFTGMTARVFQHEMMHMDGRLPFEGIGRMKLDKALKHAEKNGNNYRQYGLMKYAS